MDWPAILQALRDALTIIGVGKLVHSGYRQIKKTFRFQDTGKKFQYPGQQKLHYLKRQYKKAFGVRYKEQSVRHSLQKKSNLVGIPFFSTVSPVFKKVSIAKILICEQQHLI